MPATTSPDNLRYPVGADNVSPLRTWFANLAADVQAALTAIRQDAVTPKLPVPQSVLGAATQNLPASASWQDLPGIQPITLELSAPAWVAIDVSAWIVSTVGDGRISARVTGATTLGETQVQVGGDDGYWGQTIFTAPTDVTRSGNSHRVVRLNQGTNVITVRAYNYGGSGTRVSHARNTGLQVTPLHWA